MQGRKELALCRGHTALGSVRWRGAAEAPLRKAKRQCPHVISIAPEAVAGSRVIHGVQPEPSSPLLNHLDEGRAQNGKPLIETSF